MNAPPPPAPAPQGFITLALSFRLLKIKVFRLGITSALPKDSKTVVRQTEDTGRCIQCRSKQTSRLMFRAR